jgi:tRNA threonylcarbamoyladenosine biosynthesis protein TsaE
MSETKSDSEYPPYAFTLNTIDSIAETLVGHMKHKVVTVEGAMGAGKTTLIKALAKKLGCVDKVSSPTFSIVNTYLTQSEHHIFHFDLYRVRTIEELFELGFEAYFEKNGFIFIEWPEHLFGFRLPEHHSVDLEVLSNEKRRVILK